MEGKGKRKGGEEKEKEKENLKVSRAASRNTVVMQQLERLSRQPEAVNGRL